MRQPNPFEANRWYGAAVEIFGATMLDPLVYGCKLFDDKHRSGEGPQKPGTGPVETSVPNKIGAKMKAIKRITKTKVIGYRLGLYDPDPDNDAIEWLTKMEKPTARNLKDMSEAVLEYNGIAYGRGDVILNIGVFAISG